MRTQCLTCKYYITQEDDCEKDYPEVCLEKYECGEYEPRFRKDDCGHRYEDCRNCVPNCTSVCMRKPSECHCGFAYVCDIDRRPCDEQCERHQTRKSIGALRGQLERVSGLAEQLRRAVNDGILSEADGMPAIAALCRAQAELGIRMEELESNG